MRHKIEIPYLLAVVLAVHANTSALAKGNGKDKLDLDASYDQSLGFGKKPKPQIEVPHEKEPNKAKAKNKSAKKNSSPSSSTAKVKSKSTKPAPTSVVKKTAPTPRGEGVKGKATGASSLAASKLSHRPMIKPRFMATTKQRSHNAVSPTVEARFEDLKRRYRAGEVNDKTMWSELADVQAREDSLSTGLKAELLQAQAYLIKEAGYPITSSQHAAAALLTAPNPLNKDMLPSWNTLAAVASSKSVQSTLVSLAGTLDLKGNKAPEFGNDWNYFIGSAAERAGDKDKALEAYGKVAISDRYFMPARYQWAMIHLERNHYKEAEAALNSILYPETLSLSPLKSDTKDDLENYARMGLARIYYEKQQFVESIKMYRSVDRNSPLFYDALFEQSWSFFMGGYPNHALGALYSVESPFFAKEFNPEATMLRAIAHYWLCRYDDSRSALADFMEQHSRAVEAVTAFLERKQLREESAYQLFENFISGVSEEALGIPKEILDTAARKDSMLLVRDEYASAIAERQRLTAKGLYGTRDRLGHSVDYINAVVAGLRKDLGATYLGELKSLKEQYDQLYSQSKFLYLELLMSEKEQLLGRELHASNKITQVNMRRDVSGWGRKLQSWGTSDKGEFWWDEIGFYISKVEPMCNVQ